MYEICRQNRCLHCHMEDVYPPSKTTLYIYDAQEKGRPDFVQKKNTLIILKLYVMILSKSEGVCQI